MKLSRISNNLFAAIGTLAVVLLVGGPLAVQAEYTVQSVVFDPGYKLERGSGLGDGDPVDVTVAVINIALGLLALVAVVLFIYAGFVWILSRGNEEEVKKAKGIIYGVIFGLAIIFISYGLTQFVFNNLLDITDAV